MASVSSTPNSDSGVYKTQAEEVYKDSREELARLKDRQQRELERLSERQRTQIEEEQQESRQTIDEVKKAASESAAIERDRAKKEVDQLKKALYDRTGKVPAEVEAVQDQFKNAQKSWELERNSLESQHGASRRQMEDRLAQQTRSAAEDTEEKISAFKESVSEQQAARESGRSEERKHLEKNYKQKFLDDQEQLMREKHQAEKQTLTSLEQEEKVRENQNRQLERYYQEKLKAKEEQHRDKIVEAVDETNKSHNETEMALRTSLKQSRDYERQYPRGYNEGKAEAIREYDADWRNKEGRIVSDYERAIDREKRVNRDHLGVMQDRNHRILNEKDQYYSEVLKNQNEANRRSLQETLTGYEQAIHQLKKQDEHNRALANQRIEQVQAKGAEVMTANLENQAKTYGELMDRTRVQNAESQRELKKELQYRKTTSDPTAISPAAEYALRNTVQKEYDQIYKAEANRNEVGTREMREKFQSNQEKIRQESEDKITQLAREAAQKYSEDTNRLMSQIVETEENKNQSVRDKDFSNEREKEALHKSYTLLLENQKRHLEQAMQVQKADSDSQIQKLREEAGFREKLATRESTQKIQEVTRKYEKVLSDMASDYKFQLNALKDENLMIQRQSDVQNRLALEEQERHHQFRVAQLQQQYEERLKNAEIAQEQRIEAITRAHELSQRKKS